MNIKEYLDCAGITLKQLSLIVGVSTQSLSRYMKGAIPHVFMAEKISKSTGGKISIKRLLQGK